MEGPGWAQSAGAGTGGLRIDLYGFGGRRAVPHVMRKESPVGDGMML